MLALSRYCDVIKLLEPLEKPEVMHKRAMSTELAEIIHKFSYLEPELNFFFKTYNYDINSPNFDHLRAYLNIRDAFPFNVSSEHKALLAQLESYLYSYVYNTGITDVSKLKPIKDDISVWLGDITTLKADAIVNAANKYLLGCRNPLHICIDNAIHTFAGPRLREDCATIMSLQGKLEESGYAKITRGYALPARFVLHTVGPICADKRPNKINGLILKQSYLNCFETVVQANKLLKEKKQKPIKSIVFCSISTGVFGYPMKDAAKIAVDTVQNWLKNHKEQKLKVTFNVFAQEAEKIYKNFLLAADDENI